ncbi:MAG: hypothetical protein ABS46_03590 [Cytophagaceae bacterium SCN 52-12]|nr:MAG: hypothetical protein ABS46_03590 [Cytophagaceae bacterium SCN 52-12]
MKKSIRYIVSFLLAAGLLWFVFKDIDLASMGNRLAAADWRWIALSAFLTLLAHFFRAWRWTMMLKPLHRQVSLYASFISLLTGYFANYILPRMGEVTRCGTLYRMEGVPVNQSLGTVIADRVFDVLVLGVLLVLNFLLEFDRLSAFFAGLAGNRLGGSEDSVNILGVLAAGGLIAALLVSIWIWRSRSLRERLLSIPLVRKVWEFAEGMINGLLSVRKLESPLLFIVSTVAIWVCYYFTSYVLFFCIPETSHLGMLAGLTVLVIGSVGMTAPTQGGIGAYHLLVGNVMVLYGLTQQDGITLATFVHGTQMLLMLAAGAIAFLLALFHHKKDSLEENEPLIQS